MDFTERVRLDPSSADAYCGRGRAYASLGNWNRAVLDFDEVIRSEPRNANAHNRRALAHQGSGDTQRARADFEKAAEIDPGGEAGEKARRHLAVLDGTRH